MLQEGTAIKIINRQCPLCRKDYEHASESLHCPDDNGLLFPIAPDKLIDVELDGYVISKKIGSGSFSTVYLGTHIDSQQPVAVKVLNLQTTDHAAIKRFQKEYQLYSLINDPGIPAVYANGFLADGRPYLIVEFVDGLTLSDTLDKGGRLEPARAVQIFVEIVKAIDCIHRAGALHRDIKPSNIMLDNSGRVKVLDLGLAGTLEFESSATLTRTGETLGTAAYMSPEQCLGEQVDVRSDIYSIGCLMYECLSAEKVFPDKNVFNCMQQHCFAKPRSLAMVDGVPEALDLVIMQCLEKDPEARFQTLEDLLVALNSASHQGSAGKARKRWRTSIPYVMLLILLTMTSISLIEDRFMSVGRKESFINHDSLPTAFRAETNSELLAKRFSDIDKQISRLKQFGKLKQATALHQSLLTFKRMADGKYEGKHKKVCEIHRVDYPIAGYFSNGTGKSNGPVSQKVRVTYSDNPISLILESDVPVRWQLEALPGVSIEKIVLAGSACTESAVTGLPGGRILYAKPDPFFSDHCPRTYDKTLVPDDEALATKRYCEFVPGTLNTQTITIGPDCTAWRMQHLLWLTDEIYTKSMQGEQAAMRKKLERMTFDGVLKEPETGDGMRLTRRWIGKMTPRGMAGKADISTDLPVFAGVKFDRQWFLLAQEGLVQLDLETGRVWSVPVPAPLPEIENCSGIAKDTRRNRILIMATERSYERDDRKLSRLYSFDPKTQNWSLLSTHDGLLMKGLAYSPDDDKLYTFLLNDCDHNTGGHISALVEMPHDGTTRRCISTTKNLNGYLTTSFTHLQLAVDADNLLVSFCADRPIEKNAVIARKSGAVLYRSASLKIHGRDE